VLARNGTINFSDLRYVGRSNLLSVVEACLQNIANTKQIIRIEIAVHTRWEAAKMAPRLSPALAQLYDQAKQKGNANRATLAAVARNLVAYLMAIDRRQGGFLVVEKDRAVA